MKLLEHTVLHYTVLYSTALYHNVLYYTTLYCTKLYYILPYNTGTDHAQDMELLEHCLDSQLAEKQCPSMQ